MPCVNKLQNFPTHSWILHGFEEPFWDLNFHLLTHIEWSTVLLDGLIPTTSITTQSLFPWKTNMSSQTQWLEDCFSFEMALWFLWVYPHPSENCRCTSSWLARASMKLSRCVSRDETDGFICFWFLKGDSRKKSWVIPSTVPWLSGKWLHLKGNYM